MSISAADVAKLRKITGAGMMDCKNALTEAQGDFDKAIDILRLKGQKVSVKRADREATEGVIIAKTDGHKGIIVEINCETDFVAKNADFVQFANQVADTALEKFPENKDSLLQIDTDKGKISDLLTDQMGKIGEKIEISSYIKLEGPMVVEYNHMNNKIGVLVVLNKNDERFISIGKDVAMQIAAMNPIALDKDHVDPKVIEHELEIAREQIRKEGKPENIIDKIAQGKLQKFFKENTLLAQSFVKDSSLTVEQALKNVDAELRVVEYARVAIGG